MSKHTPITVTLHSDQHGLHRLREELCGFFAAQVEAELQALATRRGERLALLDRLLAELDGEEPPGEGGGG